MYYKFIPQTIKMKNEHITGFKISMFKWILQQIYRKSCKYEVKKGNVVFI